MPMSMSPSLTSATTKDVSENEISLNLVDGLKACEDPNMRELVKEYWCAEHKEATLENMLLDSKASTIDLLERPEVLSKLPCVRGLQVLELGAGIGRFTRILAEQGCKKIVAVDFQETACVENRRINVDNFNVEVICHDATMLDFEAESFDLIFSNWLLMYLSDAEVAAFFQNCLKWLKPGGQLFFRESCMHRSGDAARSFNPSRYRHPTEYFNAALDGRIESNMRLCVLEHGRIATYVKVKNNPNQFYWLLRKVSENVTAAAVPLDSLAPVPGRVLLAVKQPITDLSKSLVDFKTAATSVHVVTFPNVLSAVDIQELSAVPELFSLEVVEELAEVQRNLPGTFEAVHFHGFADSIELRAFTMKVAASLKPGARISGLPENVIDLINALTA